MIRLTIVKINKNLIMNTGQKIIFCNKYFDHKPGLEKKFAQKHTSAKLNLTF